MSLGSQADLQTQVMFLLQGDTGIINRRTKLSSRRLTVGRLISRVCIKYSSNHKEASTCIVCFKHNQQRALTSGRITAEKSVTPIEDEIILNNKRLGTYRVFQKE